jgi:hypothetical protein
MKRNHLIRRSLTHYRRTHAAVVLGVAVAVAVLSGALLVGDSVRGSLRDLVLLRLGNTDQVVMSAGFFREELADDIRDQVENICPIIVTEGFVRSQSGGGRAGQVRVYGIDERFFEFHGLSTINTSDALISPALAGELGASPGDSILIRVQRPSDVPLESLHSRKEDLGSTIRVAVKAVLPQSGIGEFSLETQQGRVRAVFLPLGLLQREMEVGRRVNTLLVATPAGADTAFSASSE